MSKVKLFLTLVAVVIVGCSWAQKDGELDIYLCIGQSNMAGRGYLEPQYMDTLENVYLFNDSNCFEEAVNPLNRYSSIRKEISMQRVGIGYSFAKAVAREGGRRVGLVVNARGGSSIESWLSGSKDSLLEESLVRVKEAMRHGELRGIIWHQGEANSRYPDSYAAKLKELVSTLRRELNAPEIPFIFGEISRWNWTKNDAGTEPFNVVLNNASKEITNSYCVSSSGLTPLIDETDPHFCAASQEVFGERYARVMLDILAEKREELPE